MKRRSLRIALDRLAARGQMFVTDRQLRQIFNDESASFTVMLHRHVKAGVVLRLCPGVYLNPSALIEQSVTLSDAVRHVRPDGIHYVSLETALYHHGMVDCRPPELHLMSSGTSYVFDTILGRIVFRHTNRRPDQIQAGLCISTFEGLPVASCATAVEDMIRTCRPLPPRFRGKPLRWSRDALVADTAAQLPGN